MAKVRTACIEVIDKNFKCLPRKCVCNGSMPSISIERRIGSLRLAGDLKNGRYFFELTTSPNVIWVKLDRFDLEAGAAVMVLDPDDIALSGDVTTHFQAAAAPF